MCGIFFSLGFENLSFSVIDSVAHRGPDARGWKEFSSSHGPVVIAHRRLSIVDLSDDGKQPMSDSSGRFWITFNGEIYNHLEIRQELESLGHKFNSRSDTEVLLRSYIQWSDKCLNKFNGMFSFVIWDEEKKSLFAARDRYGVKPLFYFQQGNKIAISSEIKQLINIPGIDVSCHKEHLEFLIENRYHPISDSTLFENIYHLEPGSFMIFSSTGIQKSIWYSPNAKRDTTKEPCEAFLELFNNSVRKRLLADVPVGALLSGGLDSSSIVCIISELANQDARYKDIKTFTSWSQDPLVNERFYSDAVIKKTGLLNHLAEIKDDSLFQDIEDIIYHQEEPFFSTSIQSEWNIYKTIKKETDLKVVLDGQGSDELICGYRSMISHILSDYYHQGSLLTFVKQFFYAVIENRDISFKTLGLDVLSRIHPEFIALVQRFRGRNHKADRQEFFSDFSAYCKYLIRRSIEPQLRWQDRSSMAFSIESRHPFLDFELVEFFLSLPIEEKFFEGTSKVILRKSMEGILPEVVRSRKSKFGFPSPQNTLLQNLDPSYQRKYFDQGLNFVKELSHNKNVNATLSEIGMDMQMRFFVFTLGLWAEKFGVYR